MISSDSFTSPDFFNPTGSARGLMSQVSRARGADKCDKYHNELMDCQDTWYTGFQNERPSA